MAYPSTATIKRLFAVSGNQCAFPGCTQALVDTSGGKVTGEICHIKAQSEGGPRFDSTQTGADRNGYDNLIAMCPIHHQVIDSDVSTYTVDRLQGIKKDHETRTTTVSEPSDEIAETLINKILSRISPAHKNIEYYEQLVRTGHWRQEFIGRSEFWICDEDNMCQIEISEDTREFTEPWTEVYPDSRHSWATPIYLKVNNTPIKEVTFIACDGGRIFVPMPEVETKDDKRVFYWNSDSLPFSLAKILGKYYIYDNIQGVAKISKIEIR